ncbi:hypothetical protein IZY60_11180 [Lutibacter sp. B2]|nr:hypothetical protein [Lutibacter sp. B2]
MKNNINRISNFISTASNFQYSINLKYDLESIEKIKNYIPSTSSIEIIEEILLSLKPTSKEEASNERSRILIGPYGKGKSHLALMIIALMYHKDKSVFLNLLDKMKCYKEELYQLAISVIEDQKKMLPIIVSSNSLNLHQSLLLGLRNALEDHELENIMPNTYFESALAMINKWKKEYKKTYELFSEEIDESVKKFEKELKKYNQDYYNKFVALYPALTSGAEFNPFEGMEIDKIYGDVAKKIKNKGYKGIFIVYDEFSKFLEGSIERNSAMEIKVLQDLAEKCNRSGEEQLHIMLISHKNISNYVDQLPKEKVDAWKAVSERFKTIEINHSPIQTYEVMSHAILKENKQWNQFIKDNKKDLKDITLNVSRSKIFEELGEALEKTVIQGCYPLHPISTYILPKISEKVAQNERTIFTFLSTNKRYALGHYLLQEKSKFPLMTPEYIYDYFEPLFKKENYNSEIYKIWRQITNSLKKIDENEKLAEKIIKTLGLIFIVREGEKLPPKREIIKLALKTISYKSEEINEVIEDLLNRKILHYFKSKDQLAFIEATDVDVNELILDAIEKQRRHFSEKTVLSERFYDNYIYPTRYNDEYEMVRYFEFEFIDYKELMETNDWNKKIKDKSADGIVYGILLEDNDGLIQVENKIKDIDHERIVFILPHRAVHLQSTLRRYDAIQFLIEKNMHQENDKLLHEELIVHLEDERDQILNYLNVYINPKEGLAKYCYKGEEKKGINRKSMLNRLISDICEEVYNETPVIINEMINKNELSTTIVNSRKKVLEALLRNNLEPRLGLTGYGPDVTIMRSTLIVTGILNDDENKISLKIEDLNDRKIQNTLNIIKKFLFETSKKGRTSFKELYEILIDPKNHVGIRKGIIPIYLGVVLHLYKRHAVVFRNGYEIEMTARLLEDINSKPEEFEVQLENWNDDKERFITDLERIFSDYIEDGEKEYNTFEFIVKAIQRWFLYLPKYAKEYNNKYIGNREFKKVDKKIVRLRNNLKGSKINSRDFLFSKLFKIFGYDDFSNKIVADIEAMKIEIDGSRKTLIEVLGVDVKTIFNNSDDRATLYSVMKDWYEDLNENTKNNLFTQGEHRLLKLVKNISNNQVEFIQESAKIIIGLRIEDWEDETIIKFIDRLQEFKGTIEKFNKEANSKKEQTTVQSSYKIVSYSEDNEEIAKTFDKTKISAKGEDLYNEIEGIMEDYAHALDSNENRQILMRILEKYC